MANSLLKTALVGCGFFIATDIAHAQSASFGNEVGVNLGDVRIAHSDRLQAGIQNGQISAGAGVADGVRVGGQTITSGVQGVVQAPVDLARKVIPLPRLF